MDQKHATSLTAAGFFVALMLVLAFFSWSVPIFPSIGAMALAFVLPVFAVRYGWQQALSFFWPPCLIRTWPSCIGGWQPCWALPSA